MKRKIVLKNEQKLIIANDLNVMNNIRRFKKNVMNF